MISPTQIRANEYRCQDLLAATARDRLVNEARKAAPSSPRTTTAGCVHALAHRAIAALAALRNPGVGRAAEA
ncbi:MAG: hypothetical protein H0U10_06595 [Chloroflexia bacterium]|nr:hypothetical protein [Chloroflexia bacterium]